MPLRHFIALPLFLLAAPAFAQNQNFVDETTGLKVDLFGNYFAMASPPSGTALSTVLVYDIASTDGQPTCIIGVHAAPDNGALSQAELNARTASERWLTVISNHFGNAFAVEDHEVVEQGGVAALGLTVSMTSEPDNMAQSWRFDTPNSATSMSCPTRRDRLATDSVSFKLIREGVTPR